MNHDFVRLLATLAVYLLGLLIPVLVISYSERFKQQLKPEQYATLFAIAAIIGFLLFLPALSIVAGTALLALGIAWFTAHYALSGVSYTRTLSPARFFPGDHGQLTIQLENRKILPLASLTISDPFHLGLIRPNDTLDDLLKFSGGIEVLDNLSPALTIRTAIGPFQSVTRTYSIEALKRGVYAMGPADITTGDAFGIFRKDTATAGRLEIIVYPRIYRPDEIGIPFREAMGNAVARRALIEDPTLMAGSREYVPGDPLHRMHWKATARTSNLQVRVSDPSTTAQLMLVVNLNTFQYLWQGVDLDRMEAAIEVAASIATWALDRDFSVGVRSNGVVPGQENTPRIPPSANPRQSTAIIEHLARLSYSGRFTPEAIIMDESRRLATGGSIIFVTPIITPPLIRILTSRKLSGRVTVVYCGRFAAPVVPGLPIFLSAPPRGNQRAVS